MTILKRTMNKRNTLLLTVGLAAATTAQAGFQYAARDLVLGFRQQGGTYELVVDAGPISRFTSLASGSTITIANVTSAQLNLAFTDLNGLSWSAAADVRIPGDATYPWNTMWVTRMRQDNNVQSAPWNRQGQFTQGNTAAMIDGIANGAVNLGNINPTGPDNTTTGIVEPDPLSPNGDYSYGAFIGDAGNYGTFQGDVETITPLDFTTAGLPVRADLYELKPGTGTGTYLGYFEFSPAGVMTFRAGASGIILPRPSILATTRTGTSTMVTFATVAGGQYSLRYTNSAGLASPVGTWAVAGSVSGDGSNKSLSDTSTAPDRFYAVSVAP